MKKVFLAALRAVSEVFEITTNDVLHKKTERCSDARGVLISVLADDKHLSDEDISALSGLSRSSVNHIRNHFSNRLRKFCVKCRLRDVKEELNGSEDWTFG